MSGGKRGKGMGWDGVGCGERQRKRRAGKGEKELSHFVKKVSFPSFSSYESLAVSM